MTAIDRDALIYDWNRAGADASSPPGRIQFDDETLRDGLQSPSARDPRIDDKLELIRLMDCLGLDTADVGLPGAGARAREHIVTLVREMANLRIRANVACRTVISDIAPVVDVVQATGQPLEVCAFIGSSPIRQYAENWEIGQMLKLSREAVEFAVKHDLDCMFVTEDTTRAHPDHVRALYTAAIEAGAKRVCVCDTCGHATPDGVAKLIGFVRQIVTETNGTTTVQVTISLDGPAAEAISVQWSSGPGTAPAGVPTTAHPLGAPRGPAAGPRVGRPRRVRVGH